MNFSLLHDLLTPPEPLDVSEADDTPEAQVTDMWDRNWYYHDAASLADRDNEEARDMPEDGDDLGLDPEDA